MKYHTPLRSTSGCILRVRNSASQPVLSIKDWKGKLREWLDRLADVLLPNAEPLAPVPVPVPANPKKRRSDH